MRLRSEFRYLDDRKEDLLPSRSLCVEVVARVVVRGDKVEAGCVRPRRGRGVLSGCEGVPSSSPSESLPFSWSKVSLLLLHLLSPPCKLMSPRIPETTDGSAPALALALALALVLVLALVLLTTGRDPEGVDDTILR